MQVSDLRRWALTGAVLTSLSLVGAAPLSLAKGGEAETAVSGKATGGGGGGGGAVAGKGKAADPAGTEAEAEAGTGTGTIAAAAITIQAGGEPGVKAPAAPG